VEKSVLLRRKTNEKPLFFLFRKKTVLGVKKLFKKLNKQAPAY